MGPIDVVVIGPRAVWASPSDPRRSCTSRASSPTRSSRSPRRRSST